MARIAVITDLHLDSTGKAPAGGREYDLVDMLVARLVDRMNRFIEPDLVLVLGDLIDNGGARDAIAMYESLESRFSLLEAPRIIIPGNHDGPAFYEVFGKPPETFDLDDIRFLFFDDPPEPGYNARRTDADIARMKRLSAEHDGAVVTVQHVPLFPPGSHECPYHYRNANEIIPAMHESGIVLSLSGHYHEGIDSLVRDGIMYHATGALCERPFRFDIIDIRGDRVEEIDVAHFASIPETKSPLHDAHVHTQFSYCGPGMDMARTAALAPRLGLDGVIFTEHSGQLYYPESRYWSGAWYETGFGDESEEKVRRVEAYVEAASAYRNEAVRLGFEVDIDAAGTPLLENGVTADYLVGAVHRMRTARWRRSETLTVDEQMADEFLGLCEGLAQSGIQTLAHPFRILAGNIGVESLYEPVVEILSKHGVAAEINFHLNDPPAEFFDLCLKRGVRLAFGSDAHEPWELGNLIPHLELLGKIGFRGELSDILATQSIFRR